MQLAKNLFKNKYLIQNSFYFSSKVNTIPEIFSNPTFYLENHENCMNKTGIETYSFQLNGKQINLYGLPKDFETLEIQQQYMADLSEIAIDIDQSKRVMVQADPTFHLYEKRKVLRQIQKYTKYKGQESDDLSNTLPAIPNNISELQVEPYLLDLSRANENELKQIYEIIKTKDYQQAQNFQGYFSRYFHGKNQEELESEQGQLMYREFCEQVQKQIVHSGQGEKNDLVTLIVLSILKGNEIYLGDMPSIYFRLIMEDKIELDYLRNIYKQILAFMKESQEESISGLYEMLLGQVFQQPLDFYLFYIIQQLSLYEDPSQLKLKEEKQQQENQNEDFINFEEELEKNKKEEEKEKEEKLETIACFVNNTHIEPLKIIAKHYGDFGFCRNQTFQEFMQLPKVKEGAFDTEKIEKHALLDVIFGDSIWEQEYTQVNPFPYLSEDFNSLNQNDQMEIKKNYFSNVQKYKELKKQFLKQ